MTKSIVQLFKTMFGEQKGKKKCFNVGLLGIHRLSGGLKIEQG